jgi:hypothetical protein
MSTTVPSFTEFASQAQKQATASIEAGFDFAERLLEKILHRLEQVTEQAQKAGPWAKAALVVLAVAGVAGAVAVALLWDVPFLPV